MASQKVVSPAKAGVQCFCNYLTFLDSGLRRNDDVWPFSTFYDYIKFRSMETGVQGPVLQKKGSNYVTDIENTEKLRALSRQWGCSLFGVADLRSFGKDDFLLPSAMVDGLPSAISLGFHLSDAIVEEVVDRPTPLYFQHYQRVNILLDTIGLIVTSAIQDLGYNAAAIPASQILDWKNQRAHLSHKHVARAAGLGWIGRNNLLVTERYGARIRLLTILTSIPLLVDSPASRDCGSCRACISICPSGAISERQEDFDHLRCYDQLKLFSKTLHFSHNICGVCVKACRGRKE
jgi:epoxyqueuosine reductase